MRDSKANKAGARHQIKTKLFKIKSRESGHTKYESRCFGRATSASVTKFATDHHGRKILKMPGFGRQSLDMPNFGLESLDIPKF